jgi:superfamily I DNA/RNA helicase
MHDFMVLTQRYGSELDRLKDFVFLKANSDSVPASPESREKLKKAYEQIREGKKYNFHLNSGNIKISTVHSFKGWESDTIFLLLQPKHDGSTSFDELLYTGITRTRSNLVVLNLGNKEYDEKMKQLIETYK